MSGKTIDHQKINAVCNLSSQPVAYMTSVPIFSVVSKQTDRLVKNCLAVCSV